MSRLCLYFFFILHFKDMFINIKFQFSTCHDRCYLQLYFKKNYGPQIGYKLVSALQRSLIQVCTIAQKIKVVLDIIQLWLVLVNFFLSNSLYGMTTDIWKNLKTIYDFQMYHWID